jgi:HK97 family phage prohead protease
MKLETRSFAAEVELRGDDQRTLVGVAVPYGVEARIGPRLVETFTRGAFATTDPAEVVLTVPHPRDAAQLPIGRTVALRDEPDGLHGEWYVPATRDGDEVLALAAAGVPLGLSVGFIPLPGGSRYSDGGRRVERRAALLDHVAVVRRPAYAGARVAALRDADELPGLPLLTRVRLAYWQRR